jgi:hypothetical protein
MAGVDQAADEPALSAAPHAFAAPPASAASLAPVEHAAPVAPLQRHILYVAYGADHFIHEAAYSILSLRQVSAPAAYRIAVVTDRKALLLQLLGNMPRPDAADLVTVLEIDHAQVQAWRGSAAYVHRAKPLAIRWAAAHVAAPGESLLFVDSDTVFTADPAPLFAAIGPQRVVLDELEGTVQSCRKHTRSLGKLHQRLKRHVPTVNGERWPIPPDYPLWNSGVIGFCQSDLALFDVTVALIDDLYRAIPIVTIEQIALSFVLTRQGFAVQDDGDLVFHYHFFKEFRADLAAFFARYQGLGTAALLSHLHEIAPQVRAQPKLRFNQRAKLVRQLLKRLGLGWQPLPYPWD